MKTLQFHLLIFVCVGLLCQAFADDAELQKHLDRLQNSVDHGVTSSGCEDLSVFNISCDKVAEYYIRVLKSSMCSVPQIANRCCASCSGPGHNSRR